MYGSAGCVFTFVALQLFDTCKAHSALPTEIKRAAAVSTWRLRVQRKSPEQRQRPPRLREWQQGENILGAEEGTTRFIFVEPILC